MWRVVLMVSVLESVIACQLVIGIEGVVPADTCAENECTDANAMSYRRQLTVRADTAAVPDPYSVSFIADTQALVSDGKVRADGADWRVFHDTGSQLVELHRWVDDTSGGFASQQARTWFAVNEPVEANSETEAYYVYYGQPDIETTPPSDLGQVFVFGDDFEQDLSRWQPSMRDETALVQDQEAAAGERALLIAPGNTFSAGLWVDLDLPEGMLMLSHHVRQAQRGSSLATFRWFEVPSASRDLSDWKSADVKAWIELDSDDLLEVCSNRTDHNVYFQPFEVNRWRAIDVLYEPAANLVRSRVNDGPWQGPWPDWNNSTMPVRSFAIEGEGQGGTFYVDNFFIRRYIDPEPTVDPGPEQPL